MITVLANSPPHAGLKVMQISEIAGILDLSWSVGNYQIRPRMPRAMRCKGSWGVSWPKASELSSGIGWWKNVGTCTSCAYRQQSQLLPFDQEYWSTKFERKVTSDLMAQWFAPKCPGWSLGESILGNSTAVPLRQQASHLCLQVKQCWKISVFHQKWRSSGISTFLKDMQ